MDGMADAYRVLQVDQSAELCVIQAAYRTLARRFHPDGDSPDLDRMSELNRAYAMIRDPDARRRYDVARSMAHAQQIPMAAPVRRAEAWAPRQAGQEPSILDFGRYVGWSVTDLARHDPDYLRWLCRHSSGLRFRDAITRVLPREPDLTRRANSVA